MDIILTRDKDANRNILIQLPDDTLRAVCQTDQYTSSVCDTQFWYLKLNKLFGFKIASVAPWNPQQAYWTLSKKNKKEIMASLIDHNAANLLRQFLQHESPFSLDIDLIVDSFKNAASSGRKEVVEMLLYPPSPWKGLARRKMNINVREYGNVIRYGVDIAILLSVWGQHYDLASFLLDKGVNIDPIKEFLLIVAIGRNIQEAIDWLLDSSGVVYSPGQLGTPLIAAVNTNNFESVVKLLDRGADINYIDDMGNNPLNVAISNNNMAIAKLLLQRGVDVNPDTEYSPLEDAMQGEVDVSFIPLLLNAGSNPHLNNDRVVNLAAGFSLAHLEILLEHVEYDSNSLTQALGETSNLEDPQEQLNALILLIDHGADIMAKGSILLVSAARVGNIDIVRFLLDRGVDPRGDQNNDEPLVEAAKNRHIDVVLLLAEAYKKVVH